MQASFQSAVHGRLMEKNPQKYTYSSVDVSVHYINNDHIRPNYLLAGKESVCEDSKMNICIST